MSSLKPIISKRLHDLRTERHLTQEKLAETLETTTKTYREWEKKGSIPATDFLIKLSDLYKVSTDYLLGRSDCKTTDENIKMINETTGLSEQAIESIKGIKNYTNSNISLEMLNTVLNDYESLATFLEHLHDIKANQHLDSRAMLVKTKSEVALTLLDKTAPKEYGFSIKDIVRRDALDKINMIIDKWTKRKEGD